MNKAHLIKNLNLKKKSIIIILVLIIIGIVTGYLISVFSLQIIITELNKLPIKIDTIRINRSINFYTGALVCVAVEIVLLIGILFVYLNSYRKTKSWFLLGLNVFILALFIPNFVNAQTINVQEKHKGVITEIAHESDIKKVRIGLEDAEETEISLEIAPNEPNYNIEYSKGDSVIVQKLSTGEESRCALAIPVTRLVAPGPEVAMHTPTFPVARA